MNEAEQAFEAWIRSEEGLQGSDHLGTKVWLAACRWRAKRDERLALHCKDCTSTRNDTHQDQLTRNRIADAIKKDAGL